MQQNHKKGLKPYVLTAMFAALIFLVTAYVLHIPTPATGGYIHLGDAFLYLAASILPSPLAVAAGGIGEALSDLLTGGAVYALPTLLIKSAMVLCFAQTGKSIVSRRNIFASVGAGVICIAGYYLTEAVIYRSFLTPLAEIPANLVQAGASAVIYVILGNALDRLRVKEQLSELFY